MADEQHDSHYKLLRDGVAAYLRDEDPEETQEWIDSFDAVLDATDPERARFLMLRLLERATARRVPLPSLTETDFVNTIPTWLEPEFPGDEDVEKTYRRWIRWNAAIMVHRAQSPDIGVGGHISTYAGAATLYEVGFNHFFRGKDHPGGGDQVFFQGHASPGMYARAFLEGRLTEDDLDAFRQEASRGKGLPAYPHPRGMTDFWEFPTVSMGLGPIDAIFQARFNKYLANRGIKDTSDQHVWAFLGDGELDEPEARGALQVAANNQLDNLTFVVNCNLQRLDGPVRGDGKIIQELEAFFRGAGWNVIKVIWGRNWDPLIAADHDGKLIDVMNQTKDGDYQTYKGRDGAYVREHFFGQTPETAKLVEDWSDNDIFHLQRGGHDYKKMYAAYKKALETKSQPSVILAFTIKGYGLGANFEGKNATHQMKKMTLEDLKYFRDTQQIPITDEQLEADPKHPPYYHPGAGDPNIQYMLERRKDLGGYLPERRHTYDPIVVPAIDTYAKLMKDSGKQEVATTMALVRTFKELMRDPVIGQRVVPIIPDEARTFGMDSWFPTMKIYNPLGQQYTPVDFDLMLTYKEAPDGQIMHEGINEAGSMAEFNAAGTAYATHGVAMIPMYIFYAMFGFQRTGDLMWAAGDQMARGFLIGATAGRTTLTGEGLQHMDGHSHTLAETNPAVVAYDPAFAYELVHLIHRGIDRMYGPDGGEDVIYYLTVYNQPIHQPAIPENLDIEGLHKGIYLYQRGEGTGPEANILASGIMMQEALQAADLLAEKYGVKANIYSVTSWTELAREARAKDRNRLKFPDQPVEEAFVTTQLKQTSGPYVGVSDFETLTQDQIHRWVPGNYTALGADGFGFSDTRSGARRFFNIDAESITVAVLNALAAEGSVDAGLPAQAAQELQINDPTATLGTPQ